MAATSKQNRLSDYTMMNSVQTKVGSWPLPDIS